MSCKIDWTNCKLNWSKLRFVTKRNKWFAENSTAILLYDGEDFTNDVLDDNMALFSGITQYSLDTTPKLTEEVCLLSEFNIYYGDVIVNQYTVEKLVTLMRNDERVKKNKIIMNNFGNINWQKDFTFYANEECYFDYKTTVTLISVLSNWGYDMITIYGFTSKVVNQDRFFYSEI